MTNEKLIRELLGNELNAELAQRAVITIQDLETKLNNQEKSTTVSYYKVWSLAALIVILLFLFVGEPDVFDVLRTKAMSL